MNTSNKQKELLSSEKMKNLPMTLIHHAPKTRWERRRAERETQMILKELMPIDIDFNNIILNYAEMNPEKYKEYYTYFLDLWTHVVTTIRERKQLRLVIPNAQYFAAYYSPQEMEPEDKLSEV